MNVPVCDSLSQVVAFTLSASCVLTRVNRLVIFKGDEWNVFILDF